MIFFKKICVLTLCGGFVILVTLLVINFFEVPSENRKNVIEFFTTKNLLGIFFIFILGCGCTLIGGVFFLFALEFVHIKFKYIFGGFLYGYFLWVFFIRPSYSTVFFDEVTGIFLFICTSVGVLYEKVILMVMAK